MRINLKNYRGNLKKMIEKKEPKTKKLQPIQNKQFSNKSKKWKN